MKRSGIEPHCEINKRKLMNRILNKKQAICGTVWILVACAALVLWPLRLIQEEVRAASSRQQAVVSEEIGRAHV